MSFEDRVERITLYPDNVVRLHWRVAEVLVMFGRLLDSEGQALEGLRIEGAQVLSVSDIGELYQAEVLRPAAGEWVELTAIRDGRPCHLRINIEELDIRKGIARVGTPRCN